jgi:hypothetical protein
MSDLKEVVTQDPINPQGYVQTTIFDPSTQTNKVIFTQQSMTGTIDPLGGVSVAQHPSLALGHYVKMTLTASVTVTLPAGSTNSDDLTFELTQDGTGSHVITWAGTVKFPGGAAPVLTVAANAVDLIRFKWNGTSWLCLEVMKNLILVDMVPTISVQPASAAVVHPATHTFSVTAAGYPAPAYQWNLAGVAIPGATAATYTTPATTVLMSGSSYTVTVTNYMGSLVSSAAILTVT